MEEGWAEEGRTEEELVVSRSEEMEAKGWLAQEGRTEEEGIVSRVRPLLEMWRTA